MCGIGFFFGLDWDFDLHLDFCVCWSGWVYKFVWSNFWGGFFLVLADVCIVYWLAHEGCWVGDSVFICPVNIGR